MLTLHLRGMFDMVAVEYTVEYRVAFQLKYVFFLAVWVKSTITYAVL